MYPRKGIYKRIVDFRRKIIHNRTMLGITLIATFNSVPLTFFIIGAFDQYIGVINFREDVVQDEPWNHRKCSLRDLRELRCFIGSYIAGSFLGIFFPLRMHHRFMATIFLQIVTYFLLATGSIEWTMYGSLVTAAIGTSFLETSFLRYIIYCKSKSLIYFWDFGTSCSGLFGSILYITLYFTDASNHISFLCLLACPLTMLIGYLHWMNHPNTEFESVWPDDNSPNKVPRIKLRHKLKKIGYALVNFYIPSFVCYLACYLMNITVFRRLKYNQEVFQYQDQYHWYVFSNRLGIFLAHCTLLWVRNDNLWFFVMLVYIYTSFCVLELRFAFLYDMYVTVFLVIWGGLLEGWFQVNLDRLVIINLDLRYVEFYLSTLPFSKYIVFYLCIFVAPYVNKYMCTWPPAYVDDPMKLYDPNIATDPNDSSKFLNFA